MKAEIPSEFSALQLTKTLLLYTACTYGIGTLNGFSDRNFSHFFFNCATLAEKGRILRSNFFQVL